MKGEYVDFIDPRCVVEDDPGEVVRHARPMTDEDRKNLEIERRERMIASLTYDHEAVMARERRIAMERGNLRDIRRRRA